MKKLMLLSVTVLFIDRAKRQLTLVLNETDPYKERKIIGTIELNNKFKEFEINTGYQWSPTELAMFIKMNRSFFPSKEVAMNLVTILMNYKATINQQVEKLITEKGDRTDNFHQVVNSNLPGSFVLEIPIFTGGKKEVIEVETFAHVNGREVSFVLISPGANDIIEEQTDQIIDYELSLFGENTPFIPRIEQ